MHWEVSDNDFIYEGCIQFFNILEVEMFTVSTLIMVDCDFYFKLIAVHQRMTALMMPQTLWVDYFSHLFVHMNFCC